MCVRLPVHVPRNVQLPKKAWQLKKVWLPKRQTVPERQTRQTKWSLCAAMPRRRHKNHHKTYGFNINWNEDNSKILLRPAMWYYKYATFKTTCTSSITPYLFHTAVTHLAYFSHKIWTLSLSHTIQTFKPLKHLFPALEIYIYMLIIITLAVLHSTAH